MTFARKWKDLEIVMLIKEIRLRKTNKTCFYMEDGHETKKGIMRNEDNT